MLGKEPRRQSLRGGPILPKPLRAISFKNVRGGQHDHHCHVISALVFTKQVIMTYVILITDVSTHILINPGTWSATSRYLIPGGQHDHHGAKFYLATDHHGAKFYLVADHHGHVIIKLRTKWS